MKYFVYILYSPKHNVYYIGQTYDLDKRLREHNHPENTSYTSKYQPWELRGSIVVETRSQAMKIEKYLKKKPRDFIDKVITDESLRNYISTRFGNN